MGKTFCAQSLLIQGLSGMRFLSKNQFTPHPRLEVHLEVYLFIYFYVASVRDLTGILTNTNIVVLYMLGVRAA